MKIRHALFALCALVLSALPAAVAHAEPEYCLNRLILEFRTFGVDNETSTPVEIDDQPGTPAVDSLAIACSTEYDPGPGRDLRLIPPGSTQVRIVINEYSPLDNEVETSFDGLTKERPVVATPYRPDPNTDPVGYRSRWISFLFSSYQPGFIQATTDRGLGTCYQTPTRAVGFSPPCV